MLSSALGYEPVKHNNVVGASAVNLGSLAPPQNDELQQPGFAQSTLSNRSWITDDRWSDEDDDDDDEAAAAGAAMMMPKASNVAPPGASIGTYSASATVLSQQVVLHNHFITVTTFALITYHCLYLSLQT